MIIQKTLKSFMLLGLCSSLFTLSACKKDKTDPNTNTDPTDELAIYKRIYGATSVSQDGDYVIITTTSLPDHKSPYYQGTQWESTKYEAYNGTNALWNQNPNKIAEHDLTYRIPLHPTEASTKAATPLGPIGVALNGVSFFNQYAAQRAPLTNEANGFDQYGGHPQQEGEYHYHVEPTWLTTNKGKDALLGFLLDGFPVYGPTENGKEITNNDLDEYHGHKTVTADYPNGIYHYHITAADPYLNGNGFYGTAGTVTE
jgi:hypothetical protein